MNSQFRILIENIQILVKKCSSLKMIELINLYNTNRLNLLALHPLIVGKYKDKSLRNGNDCESPDY